MLGSAKPSVVVPALDPVGTLPDHIAQDIADRTVVVAHTVDTAGSSADTAVVEDTAGMAEDTVPADHSLFAVWQ